MLNDDHSAAAGSPDNGERGLYASVMPRRTRRRKQAIAGVVGLAAILGVGAYFTTERLTRDPATVTTDVGALAPLETSAPSDPTAPAAGVTGSPSPSGPAKAVQPGGKHVAPTTSAATAPAKTVAERVAEAQAAARKAGTEVKQALPPKNVAPIVTADKLHMTETGTVQKDRHTMRLVSARLDLTGQRELAWVADKGTPFGDAFCTQKIRLSNNSEAKVRPTLLLCWKTSAKKSVYTVVVNLDKPPSKIDSVAAIDKEWARMG